MKTGFSIRNKFIMVTIFIFIVLIGFSIFLINLINQLASVTSDIIDHPLEVSNAASYANVEVLRMHRDLKEILLVDEDFEVNILVDKIRVSESKVYIALDTISYDILGEEGKVLEAEARVLFNEWKTIRSEIIDDVRDGRIDAAFELTKNKGANHIDSLERKLLDLNQYARKKAVDFQENSISLESNTERVAILGIVLVLVFVTITIYWMSWSVLGGIDALSNSLKDIMKSGEFKSVSLAGNDELTELSIIFNDLVSSLGNQLWIKEGNQLLNNILSDVENFDEALNLYVNVFCVYGEYLSVAYYHMEYDSLSLAAVVNRMSFMDDFYKMGEHYIGECALDNEEKTIKYNGDSSFDLPYSEILTHPINYNDEVFGVMCFVFKRGQSQKSSELIKSCIKDFSAYVSTYVQRRKIDVLLEDSIRINEEMTSRQISLEENQEELQAVNRTLQDQRDLLNVKTSELGKQNRELENLREELVTKYKDLEEVTKYRSQFLTNISHELRTPLNSIIVLSNMLNEKDINLYDEQDNEKIEVITKASNELLLTINDILDLSKIESGKVELVEDSFDPEQLTQEWQAIYVPLIDEKGIRSKFKNDIKNNLYGDKAKISHVVTNFLSNAIKFTEHGFVNVHIKNNNDIDYPVRIDVSDSGIGIEDNKLEVIFTEFVQTDGSISRLYGGTGLGLAICKNYANLINGKITLQSQLGEGSTFSLLLPSACLLDDYSTDELIETAFVKETRDMSKHILKKEYLDKKVLVCDDEPMNVFALSAMLEDIGVLPVAALTHEEAATGLKENPSIGMVLMDYMMPEVDGFETLKRLRKMKEWSDIPVAIVTAANLESKELEIIKREGYLLVRKPVIYNEIVKLLNANL